ncbi:OmpA family protein [Paraburkholderia susongensis]|uniref:OmpA family protein n=1 Tax=Paraburkholderia susongensis TaxID=1515439 RepID=A0A1X7M4N3_9BURK|nr:OmpA family protein [Paraburkholderia susongensis]SMG61156.1 OmpA family protein [Paraburkholderia susongensis]
MIRIIFAGLLAVSVLAGCTAASGPAHNAYTVDRINNIKTYRVECTGIFESTNTCQEVAQQICDKQPVRVVEAIDTLRTRDDSNRDPRALTFQCGEPPAKPALVAAPVPVAKAPVPVTVPMRMDLSGGANFRTNQATLTPQAQGRLDQFLEKARGTSFSEVAVSGYTDSTGSAARNLDLSQRRADAVAKYLRDGGLRAEHYRIRGFGSADPVASNSTAAGREQNRRVEVVLKAE